MRLFALACTLAASAALAQTAEPVVLYGRIHVLAEIVETTGPGAPSGRRTRVTNQASMMGVRGVESLGPSLSAWFQLETHFHPDENDSPFATRNSAVGLSGPWGSLLAGRWDSVFEQSQAGIVDPFSDQGLPDITGAAVQQGNFARRQPNAVQYWSAPWAGLRLKLGYATLEARGVNADPHDLGISLTYLADDNYVAVAYERHVDQAGPTIASGVGESGIGIAASRRFGPVKLEGQYGEYTRTGSTKQRSHALGTEIDLGTPRRTLLGIWQRSRDGGPAGQEQPACDLYGLGYRQRLSMRSFVIVEYARVVNARGNLCNFGSNPVAIGDREGPHGIGVGMRTVF